MKLKMLTLSLMSSLLIGSVSGQQIEYDDMYFNSKDREKLKASKAADLALAKTGEQKNYSYSERERGKNTNPTDSYSARNVNPEYASRENYRVTGEETSEYYDDEYLSEMRERKAWNHYYGRYNNPWYSRNYYSALPFGWNSPFHNPYWFYSSPYSWDYYYNSWWGDPWYYSAPGWSFSTSYCWGNFWNFGLSYSWGWHRNPANYYYYYPTYRSYWYPTRVVVIDNTNDKRGVYGKRNSRSSHAVTNHDDGSNRYYDRRRRNIDSDVDNGRSNNSGRSVSNNTIPSRQVDQVDYYKRNNRRSENSFSNRPSSDYNRSRNNWNNGGSRNNTGSNSNSSNLWRQSDTRRQSNDAWRPSSNYNSGRSNSSSFSPPSRSTGTSGGGSRSSGSSTSRSSRGRGN